MNPSTSGPVVLATVLLGGCSHAPMSQMPSWRIEPVQRTTHASAKESTGPVADAAGPAALARYMEGQGRTADALRFWRLAAVRAPGDPEILHHFGVALARQGLLGDALTVLRQADVMAPDNPSVLNNLGYALLMDGQNGAARDLFERALQIEPAHRRARQNLARLSPPVSPVAPAPAAIAAAVPDTAATPAAMPAAAPPARPALAGLRTEVINGNGQTGAAARVTRWLKERGAASTRVANQRPFDTKQTVVQYKPGQLAQAQALARQMAVPVKLSEIPDLVTGIDVRVVLGHDLRRTSPNASVPHARKGLAHMPSRNTTST